MTDLDGFEFVRRRAWKLIHDASRFYYGAPPELSGQIFERGTEGGDPLQKAKRTPS